MTTEVVTEFIPFEDKRLGRHVVHDPKSWDFQEELPRRAEPLRSVQHYRYDPNPKPSQKVGCCTFVSECMLGNTVRNRIRGKVLDLELAVKGYSMATKIDPFDGTYPPTDTGSSGLAAAKVAIQLGIAEKYIWYFNLDDLLRGLQNHPISFGGLWTQDMFKANRHNPLIRPTGSNAGGHQWVLSGYNAIDELISGECWWGEEFGRNGRFYISVPDFRSLFENRGDAHFTYRKMVV